MSKIVLAISAVLLSSMGVLPSEAGTQGEYPAYSGNKRMAVIMLAWKDRACPASRQNVVDRIWNQNQSLRKYYLDMSRNAMDFIPPADAAADGTVPVTTSDLYGPYTLSIDAGFDKDITWDNVESHYGSPGSVYLSGTHTVARDLAADRDGFNASDYDYIMYVTPKGPSTGSVGGYAGVNATYSHLYVLKQNYINHELGHNLGLAHSNTSVDQNGYGSQDCVMGNKNNPHLDSVHTYNMGWYPDATFSLESYGQFTIENLAQPDTDNVKVLRFDRASHGASSNPDYNVWVSYRVRGIGQDSGLNSNWDNKVNIHYCKAGSLRPGDSSSRYYYNNNVTKFLVGGSYTDPDGLCEVRYLRQASVSNASAVVQLIDPNGNQPPSLQAQTIHVSPGSTNFTLVADDPEGDALTYEILSAPSMGMLDVSGSMFTYSVTNVGTTSFTVRANDGQYDSMDRLVTIEVVGATPPTADAGPDQSAQITPGQTATPVAGANIYLDAGLDDGTNNTWEDSLGLWNVSVDSGVNFVGDAGSALPGITSAYDFPGGLSGSGGCQGTDLEGLGVDKKPISLELWFKPDASGSYSSNGQVLWETGGGTGLGIFYNNGSVEVAHDSNAGQISADVSGVTNEFIQVVMTFDTGSSSDNFKLYINGVLEATGSRSDSDLSGSDESGLGRRGESNVGGAGNGDSSTESFDGKIALFRAYHDRVLSAAEVVVNYESVAGSTRAAVVLNGSVNDPDGDEVFSAWSVVNGPASVAFADSSMPATTAYFTEAGSYTLELSASDGIQQVSDQVVITILDNTNVTYTLTASAGTGGAITPDGAVVVNEGDDQSFVIAAGANYSISDVLIDSVSVGAVGNYTFTNVLSDHTISATFAIDQYTVTYLAGANGSVSGTATQTVDHGSSSAAVTAVSDTGYAFADWSDGRTDNPRTDVGVTADLAVSANFVPVDQSTVPLVDSTERLGWFPLDTGTNDMDGTLALSLAGAQTGSAPARFGAGSMRMSTSNDYATVADHVDLNLGGPWSTRTISLWFKNDAFNGRQLVMEEGGSTRGFNIYLDDGTLYVGGWDSALDGADVDVWNGTWLNLGSVPVGQWHHVALVLDAAADPVRLSNTAFKAYLNGALAASGQGMQVSAHADDLGLGGVVGSTLYHDAATTGHSDFMGEVDDVALWNRALSNAEVAVLAEQMPSYTITATSGSNGSVSPSGAVVVGEGDNQSFTITSDANYHIADVLVDSVSVGAVASYTFTNVLSDHTISATFSIDQHTVTYLAGANGSISGTATQTVDHGSSSVAVTALPDSNYSFVEWSDGNTNNPRSDANVTGAISVTATFAPLPVDHTITVEAPVRGMISPDGAVTVADGGSQAFVITPDKHYIISSVLTNGSPAVIEDAGGFTFHWNNVIASGALEALFVRKRTSNKNVPTAWLESSVPSSTNDYEAAALEDPDGDGFSTGDEYWSGTDPMDAGSHLALDAIRIDGTNVVLNWSHSQVDPEVAPLSIQMCTNLTSGAWISVGSFTPVDGTNSWLDAGGSQRYYRIAVTNAP